MKYLIIPLHTFNSFAQAICDERKNVLKNSAIRANATSFQRKVPVEKKYNKQKTHASEINCFPIDNKISLFAGDGLKHFCEIQIYVKDPHQLLFTILYKASHGESFYN